MGVQLYASLFFFAKIKINSSVPFGKPTLQRIAPGHDHHKMALDFCLSIYPNGLIKA